MRLEFTELCGATGRSEQTAAGRRLLKETVKSAYGVEDFTPSFNENGKPLLDFCFFSLSHSGKYVACALSDRRIGVDIQKYHPIKRRSSYKLFTAEENAYIAAGNPDERFFTLWTMKEAYIKAIGGRLSDMKSVNFANARGLSERYGGFRFLNGRFNEYFWSVCFEE